MNSVDVEEAFAKGYAIHGPDCLSTRAILAFEVIRSTATEDAHLDLVTEIAKYEGTMATLELRRQKLSKRWAKKIAPVPKKIAKVFPTEEFVKNVHRHIESANLGHQQSTWPVRKQRTDIAKGVAFMALRSVLRDNPDLAEHWTELVSLAEAEGQAEGIVQATALMQDSGTLPKPAPHDIDLDQLYDDTLANLRKLDSFGANTPKWITDQLSGLAGDMGKAIADSIARNFSQDDLITYVNKVIDKGDGAKAYIDESIHFSMQQASISQMAAIGVDQFDYVAMPDACPICAPLDSSLAGPYTLETLPSPPQHINCRCTVAEAGTVS